MKIAFAAIGLCLAMAIGPAFADKAEKPRFKQNGDLCTPAEIANPPVVEIRYRATTTKMKIACLTRSEWAIERSLKAEKQYLASRAIDLSYSNPATATSGAEAALSQ